ncbi:MAG TPA: hypothetical protein EYN28_05595 [Flavobacteriales bacterium]|nr:hypothetical protein [Flavobacteriales bacterium]
MNKNIQILRILIAFSIFSFSLKICSQEVEFRNSSNDFGLANTFHWNVNAQQIIWGTKWHSINFQKSVRKIPGGVLCGYWSGWEAWRETSLMWRQEKLLGVTEQGQSVYSWLQIGGAGQFLPELQIKQFSVISQLGLYLFSSEGSIDASFSPELFRSNRQGSNQQAWPWEVSGIISTHSMNGVEIGFGMNSSLIRNSWNFNIGKQIDSFKVKFQIDGPVLFISCMVQWQRDFKFTLIHESSVIGNGTKWAVSW